MLPAPQAIRLTIEVLSALAAAHAEGIVHRDVKPHNILLDRDGHALLADFGIARVPGEDRRTRTGVAMGSLAYMPHEQRLDAAGVGPTADVYAAGATLYHLVTGANPVDLFQDDERSPRWSALPAPLRPVVRRACAARPEDRYPTARAMADDLLAVLHAPDPRPPDPTLQLPPRAERRRWPLGVLAALGLAAAALAASLRAPPEAAPPPVARPVEPLPEPTPAPPSPEPIPSPVPAAEPRAPRPDPIAVAGRWTGPNNGLRFTLELRGTAARVVGATSSVIGDKVERHEVRGTWSPADRHLSVTEQDGADPARYELDLDGDRLTGPVSWGRGMRMLTLDRRAP